MKSELHISDCGQGIVKIKHYEVVRDTYVHVSSPFPNPCINKIVTNHLDSSYKSSIRLSRAPFSPQILHSQVLSFSILFMNELRLPTRVSSGEKAHWIANIVLWSLNGVLLPRRITLVFLKEGAVITVSTRFLRLLTSVMRFPCTYQMVHKSTSMELMNGIPSVPGKPI